MLVVLNSSATKVLRLENSITLTQQNSGNKALAKKNSNSMCMLSKEKILLK